MKQGEYNNTVIYYKILENKSLEDTWYDRNEKVKYNLCKAYLELGDYNEASKYLFVIDNSDIYDYAFEIAQIYEKGNKYNEAEKYYCYALHHLDDLDPLDYLWMNRTISLHLGKIYLKINQIDLAEKYLITAVEDKNDLEANFLLGNIYEKQNNLELAKKYYSHANTEEAKNRLNIIKQKENLINSL